MAFQGAMLVLLYCVNVLLSDTGVKINCVAVKNTNSSLACFTKMLQVGSGKWAPKKARQMSEVRLA